MLVYRRSDTLEIIEYTGSDLVGDRDDLKSISSYVFMATKGTVS